ncbi:hypothetical protein DV737_g2125, partial [Chaetothyriales sp. CBS 132003]
MPLFDFISTPVSVHGRELMSAIVRRDQMPLAETALQLLAITPAASPSHPSFGHLTLLVFEAVLEVVCVSAPGYLVARQGMFDSESQKFLANINVQLFTPCLIFTKLASQLTAEKLADLAIIPVIFIVQTLVSYACSWAVGRLLRFKKRQQNFIIAMGVFGNSNSLPISLVISLSKTLKGLHWDKIPGDNDDEVAARGILYLLIFQQLGQLLRWTWGYNVLLAPSDTYTEEEGGTKNFARLERGRYRDDPDEDDAEVGVVAPDGNSSGHGFYDDDNDDEHTRVANSPAVSSGVRTPYKPGQQSRSSSRPREQALDGLATPNGHDTSLPKFFSKPKYDEDAPGWTGKANRLLNRIHDARLRFDTAVSNAVKAAFSQLPSPLQRGLAALWGFITNFLAGLWEFMNPPLWAMLIAIVVASIPSLQHLFFDRGTFVRNSVTRAIEQSGGVAVPLILVVLGGNLARNTLPKDNSGVSEDPALEHKLLIASLVSRMLLPTIIMAPMLALVAKYVPVSIVDDKIFVIVCFLLSGAPSALQLAQICQINNVYMSVMAKILFQSYVVWILPSTLIQVMLALETVEWATV